jgi:hypothetical protein
VGADGSEWAWWRALLSPIETSGYAARVCCNFVTLIKLRAFVRSFVRSNCNN